jgi:hypothetical protein
MLVIKCKGKNLWSEFYILKKLHGNKLVRELK